MKRNTCIMLLLCALLLMVPHEVFANVVADRVDGFIYRIAVGIGGTILYLAGGLFDYVTIELVVEMGDKLSNTSGLGGTIEDLWIVVRDTFNLLFIFGVIYIGFRVILFSEDSNVHKTLGWLIIAALMVNFSLFITQVVVDFTNATSYQIYLSMISSEEIDAAYYKTADDEKQVSSISSTFMQLMRMTSYTTNEAIAASEEDVASGRAAFYGLLMMFLMLIAAFVFAAGAFMLLARFVGLIIFMIFSPAMFIGMVFPYFKKYQRMWWDKFLRYSFVAPAYLFMLYLSITMLSKISITGDSGDSNIQFAQAFTTDAWIDGSFMIFLYFFLVAAFMIASLYVANQMSIYGSDVSLNMLQSAGKGIQSRSKRLAGGAAFGLPAGILRNTVGAKADQYKNSKYAKRLARSGGVAGAVGRAAIVGADNVSDASFDARRVAGFGKNAGIGEGKKGGYTQRQKDINKREDRIAKLVEDGNDPRYYADAGLTDIYEEHERAIQNREQLRRELAQTTDENRRRDLQRSINTADTRINQITNPKLPKNQPEDISDSTWARMQEEVQRRKEYNKLRTEMKSVTKNEFATILETRGQELPPVFRQIYQWTVRSANENKTAAATIRKEVSKKDNDRLIDAIKSTVKDT